MCRLPFAHEREWRYAVVSAAIIRVHAFVGRPLSHQVFFSQGGKLGDEYQLHCWSRDAGPESS
jgi:hypothetical protein